MLRTNKLECLHDLGFRCLHEHVSLFVHRSTDEDSKLNVSRGKISCSVCYQQVVVLIYEKWIMLEAFSKSVSFRSSTQVSSSLIIKYYIT